MGLAALDWAKMMVRKDKPVISERFLPMMPSATTSSGRRVAGFLLMNLVFDRNVHIGAICGTFIALLIVTCSWVWKHLCLAEPGPRFAVGVISLLMFGAVCAAVLYLWSKLIDFAKIHASINEKFFNGCYQAPKNDHTEYPSDSISFDKLLVSDVVDINCSYSFDTRLSSAVRTAFKDVFVGASISADADTYSNNMRVNIHLQPPTYGTGTSAIYIRFEMKANKLTCSNDTYGTNYVLNGDASVTSLIGVVLALAQEVTDYITTEAIAEGAEHKYSYLKAVEATPVAAAAPAVKPKRKSRKK